MTLLVPEKLLPTKSTTQRILSRSRKPNFWNTNYNRTLSFKGYLKAIVTVTGDPKRRCIPTHVITHLLDNHICVRDRNTGRDERDPNKSLRRVISKFLDLKNHICSWSGSKKSWNSTNTLLEQEDSLSRHKLTGTWFQFLPVSEEDQQTLDSQKPPREIQSTNEVTLKNNLQK